MQTAEDIFEDRVATLAPGYGDLFVITLVGDKIVFNEPVTSYDLAVKRAEFWAKKRQRRPFTIKVIALGGHEACKLLDIKNPFGNQTPREEYEFRQQARKNCISALKNCRDPRVRADAYDVLRAIGVRE